MHALRRLIAYHRTATAVLLALALAMKLLIPAGYMIDGSARHITVTLCSGTGPMTMAMPMSGGSHHDKQSGDKAEMPCAFSGLSLQSLSAVDPVLLAAAILFIVATVFRAILPAPAAPPLHLRPPLRGPPATF